MPDIGAALPSDVMDCIDAAARYLATDPEAVERALATHVRTRNGRCAACGRRVHWPCAVASSAARARLLLDPTRRA